LTDENEDITDTFIYTAYGEEVARTGTTTNPFGYKGAVGYYTDESTSDIYVRNRTYEPTIGRWLSTDPLGFVDGTSLYRAYFVPRVVDPLGLSECRPKVRKPIDGEAVVKSGSLIFSRPIYGWAFYYEYEFDFLVYRNFTNTTFEIAANSSGRVIKWNPYPIGGHIVGHGEAESHVVCTISCVTENDGKCRAVVDYCDFNGKPNNAAHNEDSFWQSLTAYSYSYKRTCCNIQLQSPSFNGNQACNLDT
jgi:RHS repeat-associated protein